MDGWIRFNYSSHKMNSSPVNFRSIDRWAENFGLYDINMTVNKFQLTFLGLFFPPFSVFVFRSADQ